MPNCLAVEATWATPLNERALTAGMLSENCEGLAHADGAALQVVRVGRRVVRAVPKFVVTSMNIVAAVIVLSSMPAT